VSGIVATTPVRPDASGITVEARETSGGTLVDTQLTDAAGAFSFDLPADTYNISAVRSSFLTTEYAGLVVNAGDTTDIGTGTILGGDINNNGTINITDIASMAAVFGTADAASDLNGDGTVNITDVASAGASFGLSSPIAW